jgi:hypothetical protein
MAPSKILNPNQLSSHCANHSFSDNNLNYSPNLDVLVPAPAIGESAHPLRPQICMLPEAPEYLANPLEKAT